MIGMINANTWAFVCQPGVSNCGPGGLGLMNNVLPYLIPLVLLWIAYRETKRTSAMFAKEIVEMPEKIGKSAVMAGLTVGMAAATAGAGAVATKLGPTMGKVASGLKTFGEKHKILGAPIRTGEKLGRWTTRKMKPPLEKIEKKVRPPVEKAVRKLKIDKAAKLAGRGLKGALWGYTKEKKVAGRRLTEEEIKRGYLEKLSKRKLTLDEMREKQITRKLTPKEITDKYIEEITPKGEIKKRDLTPDEIKEEEVIRRLTPEEMQKGAIKEIKRRDLTPEEIKKKQIIRTTRVKEPGIAKQVIEGTKDAWKDWLKKRLKPPKKRKFTRAEREALEEKGVPSEVLEEFEVEAGGEE
jgi:hypothetical protein